MTILCYFCSDKAITTAEVTFNPEEGDYCYSKEVNLCKFHDGYGYTVMLWDKERKRWIDGQGSNITPKRPTKEEARWALGERRGR
jgi:hypothetical protein